MRKCRGKYTDYDEQERKFVNREFEDGIFHQWGTDYEEFESGPGNFTVGIVELPDGKVIMPIARFIQFVG